MQRASWLPEDRGFNFGRPGYSPRRELAVPTRTVICVGPRCLPFAGMMIRVFKFSVNLAFRVIHALHDVCEKLLFGRAPVIVFLKRGPLVYVILRRCT